MLNNAWPSMIWHLYDYNLDADAGYFAVKKACEPLHIQYSYDDQSIVVVNSTYHPVSGLHASIDVHGIRWNELYSAKADVTVAADSSQRVSVLPQSLNSGLERIFFIDLTLTDSAGHVVSHNFYWVPYTLTTFNWAGTDYTHTPAELYPDLTALAHLPPATIAAHAEIADPQHGRELQLHLQNRSDALAFQVHASVRTVSGDLVAPVFWSDNWIEIAPGASTTLTVQLPENAPPNPVVQLDGWNIPPATITPIPVAAASVNH
jgi:exo-1,4-beta-D-glucosaminidase